MGEISTFRWVNCAYHYKTKGSEWVSHKEWQGDKCESAVGLHFRKLCLFDCLWLNVSSCNGQTWPGTWFCLGSQRPRSAEKAWSSTIRGELSIFLTSKAAQPECELLCWDGGETRPVIIAGGFTVRSLQHSCDTECLLCAEQFSESLGFVFP